MREVESLQFQQLDQQGLEELILWARDEGWNPGSNDAGIFWATDPEGFYGFFDKGRLVAGGAIVSYGGEFGFMGLFIVRPEYRDAGVGRKLWHKRRDTLLSRLRADAVIGMDGVVAMQPFYNKGGFEIAFRDERYELMGRVFEQDGRVSVIADEDVPAVLEYDKLCFGCARPQFMKPWLMQREGRSFKFEEEGLLKGFAVLRKADIGYKIGPLFADNEVAAEALYRACLHAVVGQPVYIDIPLVNDAAVALMRKYNAVYVFECARMYMGKMPGNPWEKVFGITSFELG